MSYFLPSSNLFALANGSRYYSPEEPVDVEQKNSRNSHAEDLSVIENGNPKWCDAGGLCEDMRSAHAVEHSELLFSHMVA